jgi:hypothetical protein
VGLPPPYPLAVVVAVDHFIQQEFAGFAFLFLECNQFLRCPCLFLGAGEEAIQEGPNIGLAGFLGLHMRLMHPSKDGNAKGKGCTAARVLMTAPTATPQRASAITVSSWEPGGAD